MARKPKTRELKPYKTYRFIDKDPVIDILRTGFKDQGMTEREVAGKSGVSRSCYGAWFRGGVKRPQFASVQATAKALGYTFRMIEDK